MNIINQFLNSYKVVKLFALEKLVINKINQSRSDEINKVLWYTILGAIQNFIVVLLPIVVTTLTLLCQVYVFDRSHAISAAEGFTTLLLFKLLQGPMYMITGERFNF
jgi:hypothetical protein